MKEDTKPILMPHRMGGTEVDHPLRSHRLGFPSVFGWTPSARRMGQESQICHAFPSNISALYVSSASDFRVVRYSSVRTLSLFYVQGRHSAMEDRPCFKI
uniref:Uncharacterized protein n=1 Tax=Odontella aurita TaxID=265563 RepID=A0A7S4NJ38_9STRA